ncbi:MAG: universal stress protein [Planctomycetales bacterium]|nr:universal stress protein [Planctomycetales bacterium]
MLDKILVPLDGSPLAEGILTHVRRLLVRRDAEVRLLRVIPDRAVEGAAWFPEEPAETVQKHLERIRDLLAIQGVSVHAEVRVGDPAEKILKVADDLRPSLIAMSTHGRSGPARWLLGSVAERVLRGARHPLLLANPSALTEGEKPREFKFRRLLVPLDGSEMAAKVLPLVEGFAKVFESEVVLLHVVPVPVIAEGPLPYAGIPVLPTKEDAAAAIEPQREALARTGIPTRVSVLFGGAAAGILDAVTNEKADLIAMTTHGRTGFSRWVLGSVAEKVARHSPCPVLVLRTVEAAEEREARGAKKAGARAENARAAASGTP